METRSGVELRADGRTLTGAAIRYGDVSPTHRERFRPGSLTVSPDLAPTLGHRTGRVLAYGPDVRVRDREDALIVSARLPRTEVADMALEGVRTGRYRGWSVEFLARRESRDADGIRVIEAADLPGLALVDSPSYPGSGVEARRKRVRRMRSKVPRSLGLQCRCGPGDCEEAVVEGVDLSQDVLGYLGDYSKPLGKATAKATPEAVEVAVEIVTSTSYAADMVALMEAGVSPIVRPYPDPVRSVSRKVGKTLVYEKLAVAGWIATFTDQTGGFPPASLAEDRHRAPRSAFDGSERLKARADAPKAVLTGAGGRRQRKWL